MTQQDQPKPTRSLADRLSFETFEIDLVGCRLLRHGREVSLEPRALDLLCYLAARPGALVRKDELLWHVWHARTLSDSVLSNTIGKVRKALGQAAGDEGPIETVRSRGYRWRPLPCEAPRAAVVLPPSAAMEAPFVGRRAALAQLAGALDAAANGCGKLVWIVGDAGVGKTCLLEQLASRACARGFSVWRGAGYDGAGTPAYWPCVEVLRAAHAELGEAAFRRHLPANARALGKLVPELVAHGVTDGDSHAARFTLFDELTRWLESASGEAPRLVVLDDLHWADAATLELLAYAARALDDRPLLLAAALRERDAALTSAHTAALARIERSAVRVALAGLSADEVAELVTALRDLPQADQQWVLALHERTDGNPFFVKQIVELLSDQQSLTASSLDGLPLPAAVRKVLGQRVAGLGASGRDVLAAAAVIGQVFDARLLANVLERSLPETLAELERARRAGVVERRAGAPHEYCFSHALLREVLYEELDWARCGAFHAALAHGLAARPLTDARHLGEVARHYLFAVPTELGPCLQFCRRAAAAAREASGYEAAAELMSRARDKLAAEGGDPQTYGELLLELGFDQLCSGDRPSAWQTLERGAELASQRGDARQLSGFVCRMADWLDAGGDEASAVKHLDAAFALVSPSAVELRALLLARRAKLDPRLAPEQRIELLDEAEKLAADSGEPTVAIDVAFSRAHLRDPVRPELNLAAAARYRALVQEFPNANAGLVRQMRGATADVTECSAALALGDFAAADRALARWTSLAETYQLSLLRDAARLASIGRALAEARFDAVEAALQPRADAATGSGAPEQAFLWYFVLLAEARDQLALFATLELPPVTSSAQLTPRQRMILPLMLAWLYARTGRSAAARDQLAALPALELARLPSIQGDVGALCLLAEIYCEVAARDAAPRLYAQLAPHARLNAVGPVFDSRGCVEHYLGMLAELMGEPSAARGHFENAACAHAAWRMPVMLERSRSKLGALGQ